MAARRYFTLAWLTTAEKITWLKARLREFEESGPLINGKQIVSWGAGDSSVSKQIDSSLPAQEIAKRLKHDLAVLDPVNFPPSEYFPVTRTRLRIYTSDSE